MELGWHPVAVVQYVHIYTNNTQNNTIKYTEQHNIQKNTIKYPEKHN